MQSVHFAEYKCQVGQDVVDSQIRAIKGSSRILVGLGKWEAISLIAKCNLEGILSRSSEPAYGDGQVVCPVDNGTVHLKRAVTRV